MQFKAGSMNTMFIVIMLLLPFSKQALVFSGLQYKSFENTVGKGEITCVFYPFGEHSATFIEFEIFVWNFFEYGRV